MITYTVEGVSRSQWDPSTRVFTMYDWDGLVIETRPYTDAENAWADEVALHDLQAANEATLKTDTKALISTVRTLIGDTTDLAGTTSMRAIKNQTKANIAADPGLYIKAINQNAIDTAQALIKVLRLVSDTFDGVN